MTDEVYRYDFNALATAHEDIAAARRDFEATHAQVNDLLRKLDRTWTEGKAAEAVHSYQVEWLTVFADVIDELRALEDAADSSRRNAVAVEAMNRTLWNG